MSEFTVLIIEDDKITGEMLKAVLSEDGYEVLLASSIGVGAKILERENPDIIILDRMLPDGDGLQLCAGLKQDPLYKSMPIILLSNKSKTADKVVGIKLGADDYMTKPFAIEELKARMESILKRTRKDSGEKSA